MNSIYHVAFVVPQLEESMAAYGRALGLTFRSPLVRTHHVKQRSSDGPITGRMTYSTQGPVYVELMEISGEGLWAPHPNEGVHHVGMWSKDPLRQGEEMEVEGFEWEGSIVNPDGSVPIVFVRKGSMRIELVSELRRQVFMDWVSGKTTLPSE